eukprot:TRINITY_DN1564_c0_g1_i4.p1 TRINITY_DN1564_c0_g1~~TRINITY_DN1564_c0_g1_i4.p1  ORF type:complete len:262 (-),score=17.44 TRINITY_DN1564_c0_g1_i4:262-1047(-)
MYNYNEEKRDIFSQLILIVKSIKVASYFCNQYNAQLQLSEDRTIFLQLIIQLLVKLVRYTQTFFLDFERLIGYNRFGGVVFFQQIVIKNSNRGLFLIDTIFFKIYFQRGKISSGGCGEGKNSFFISFVAFFVILVVIQLIKIIFFQILVKLSRGSLFLQLQNVYNKKATQYILQIRQSFLFYQFFLNSQKLQVVQWFFDQCIRKKKKKKKKSGEPTSEPPSPQSHSFAVFLFKKKKQNKFNYLKEKQKETKKRKIIGVQKS